MPDTKQTDEFYSAARDLLPEMDDEMRHEIEALLKQAEEGRKTDNLIIEIITENCKLRHMLREKLGKELEHFVRYLPLGGNPKPIPAQKYVCPVEGHDYSKRISKAGEDAGNCPEHKVPLILASEKKRGR